MFQVNQNLDMNENYQNLFATISSHLDDEPDLIANLANIAAFLYHTLPDLNWAGFYIVRAEELVLGPFVGKPACTRIEIGNGVCGTAAAERHVVNVPDVHAFPGHIACDSESNSEIVLPLYRGGEVFGVLDIDSPVRERFSELDEDYLTKIAGRISEWLGCGAGDVRS